MSNIQVQLRRGTTTQHGSFTGAQGELTVDTDKNALVLHDGATAGGIKVANSNVTATGSTAARNLEDRFSDVVNVKDFGAVGNGSTDDRAAIQSANDYAASLGLPLYFPSGVYGVSVGYTTNFDIGISGTLNPSLSITTSWFSSGKATIKQLNTFNVGHSGANVAVAIMEDKSGLLLKNIIFDGQCTAKGATTNTDGSLFSTTTNNDRNARFTFVVTAGVITSITLTDGGYGYTAAKIVHDAASRSSYKDFFLPSQASGSGLDASYTVDSNGTITGVTINNGGSGYPSSIALLTGDVLPSATLERNWSNGSNGVVIRRCIDITIESCEFNNTLRSGLRIDAYGSTTGLNTDGRRFGNILLSNCKTNRNRGEFGDGIYVAGVDNVQHSNCLSYDVQRINFVVEISGSNGDLVCENINYVNCTADYAHHHIGQEHNIGFWVEAGTDIKYTNCTAKNVYGGFTASTGIDITKDTPTPDIVTLDYSNCKVDDSVVGWTMAVNTANSVNINLSNCSALIDHTKGVDWMSGHTNAYPPSGSWNICSGLNLRGSTDATVDQIINIKNFNVEIINNGSHAVGGTGYAGLLDNGFSSISGSKRVLNIDGFYTKYRNASNASTQINKQWDITTDAPSDGTPLVGDIVLRGRAFTTSIGSDFYLTGNSLVNLSADYFSIVGSAGYGTGEAIGSFLNDYYISNSNIFLNTYGGAADRLCFKNCPLLDWKFLPSNIEELVFDSCVLQHTADNADNNEIQTVRSRIVNSTVKRKLKLRPVYQPSSSSYRVSHIFENNVFEFDYAAAQLILEQSAYDGTKKFNLIFKNNLFHDLGTGGDRSIIQTTSSSASDAMLYRIYGTGNLVDSRINKIGLWTFNANAYHISDIADLELVLTSSSGATGIYIYGNQAGGNTVFAESIVLT